MKYTVETESYYRARILTAIANFIEDNDYLGDMLSALASVVSEASPYIGATVGDKVFAPTGDLEGEFVLRSADEMKADIQLVISVLERLRERIELASQA